MGIQPAIHAMDGIVWATDYKIYFSCDLIFSLIIVKSNGQRNINVKYSLLYISFRGAVSEQIINFARVYFKTKIVKHLPVPHRHMSNFINILTFCCVMEPGSTWSSNFKLNLAMLSYSTGLSIPRVASPFLLRTRIGILLLIPLQVVAMFVITIPCIFMELALGQYSGRAVIRVWDLCPFLRGIGFCSFLTFLIYQIYYSFLCTCTLCFTFLSMTSESQWKSCNKTWNKINCFTLADNYTRRVECNQRYSKEKCDKMQWQSSVEQFYFNRILHVDDSLGYVGAPQYELLVYALVTTMVIFFANCGGPKSTEKFLIALAVVPTIQLVVLFFAPLTDYNGFVTLHYLFTQMEITRLGDFKIWGTIADLSLSSSGLGFGAYITLGAHCHFRSPLHFRAILIGFATSLFTVLYSVTLQNFLVSLCLQSKMLIEDFFNLEQDLAMPEAVFFLPHSSRFWMTMWLSNSYMLGLRSLIVMMSLNAEVLYNSVPNARKRHNSCIFAFCFLIYGGGIFFSTKLGYSVVKILDKIINEFCLLFLTGFQLIGVIYVYGLTNFRDDVHFMLGVRPSMYWNVLYALNPILLGAVLIYSIHSFYDKSATVRIAWVYILENFFLWASLVVVVLYSVFYTVAFGANKELTVVKPVVEWGPRHGGLANSRRMFEAYNMAKEYLYRQKRFGQLRENEI